MNTLGNTIACIVRSRGGRVGPHQLWEVKNGEITQWDDRLGPLPTPEEITVAETHLQTTAAAWSAAAAAFAALSPGKQALWEPVRVKVGEAIQAGNFPLALEIITTVPSLYDGMEDDRATFLSLFA